MSHVAVALVSLIAFVLLALAMDRHQQELFARSLSVCRAQALRAGGWVALLASLAIEVHAYG